MGNNGNSEETYRSIINDALNVTNSNKIYTLDTDELEEIIRVYLDSLSINMIAYTDASTLASKLGIDRSYIFEIINKYCNIELSNFDEFKTYIKHRVKHEGYIEVFISKSGIYSEDEYRIPDSYRELLELCKYNVNSIEQLITEYLINNKIQVHDCIINTVEGVGVRCQPHIDVIKELVKILDKSLEIIMDTVYWRAIQRLNDLEKRVDVVNYREEVVKSSYSNMHTLLDIRDKIDNNDAIISKYKPFYKRYDALVNKAQK